MSKIDHVGLETFYGTYSVPLLIRTCPCCHKGVDGGEYMVTIQVREDDPESCLGIIGGKIRMYHLECWNKAMEDTRSEQDDFLNEIPRG